MKDYLVAKEAEIDEYFNNLGIWKYPYFTIYLSLSFHAEKIDFEKDGDNSGDFFARMSTFHEKIVELSLRKEFDSTWSALSLSLGDHHFPQYLDFLYAYGHFSFLMPQIHRNIFNITKSGDNSVLLNFKTENFVRSEITDRFLSEISLPVTIEYSKKKLLEEYLYQKVKKDSEPFDDQDLLWIRDIFSHHLSCKNRVELLSDKVLEENLGFNNLDFDRFEASLRACTDFMLYLARVYKSLSDEIDDKKKKEELVGCYLEWCNCCLTYRFIDLLIHISDIDGKTFHNILPYFITIYSQPKATKIRTCSHLGEGYMPPLTLTENRILLNPLITRNFLSFNNILYSLSKKERKLFDEKISANLEPTLINQVDRVFSKFNALRRKKNVKIEGGEIDYLVLSEVEKVCLVFQIKATLAPVSSRSTDRVQTRSLEGIKQLEYFRSKTEKSKLKLVNEIFGTDMSELKFIDILLVRSCAGSEDVWSHSHTIINYQLLCGLLGNKLNNNNKEFSNFEVEVRSYFDKNLEISSPEVSNQELNIKDLSLTFPIIDFKRMVKARLKIFKDCSILDNYRSAQ